jgi:Zn-dependent protease
MHDSRACGGSDLRECLQLHPISRAPSGNRREICVGLFEESLAPRTRFDLKFRLGDIPVRIHPFFWLSTFLLGLNGPGEGIDKVSNLLIWIAIVFVSVLVHELGHVLMGRYFGSWGHIVLTGFCGLAIGSNELPHRWQRNAVSLAGPGAGFLFAGLFTALCWWYNAAITQLIVGSLFGVEVSLAADVTMPPPIIFHTMYTVIWINFYWGLVNLLPIWPLDGGQISRETYEHYRGRDGVRLSLILSLVVAACLAALALIEMIRRTPLLPFLSFGGTLFPVLFFGLLALQSWQLLRFIRLAGSDWDGGEQQPRAPWEQDADWWKHGNQPWND